MLNFTSIPLILVIVANVCLATNNCYKNANLYLYEEMGCKPIKSDAEECPSRYECYYSQNISGCIYKSKNLQVGARIDFEETFCEIGCGCDGLNTMSCGELDCQETSWNFEELLEGCYYEYELDNCCNIGIICNTTKTCQVEGKTYKIGEEFYPESSCLRCVCHEQFTGELDEKTCMKQICNSQIYYAEEISKSCAAAYFDTKPDIALCCPDVFVCPKAGDDIKAVNRDARVEAGVECAYGDKKLKLGEGFNTTANPYTEVVQLQCECLIPPLVTCKQI